MSEEIFAIFDTSASLSEMGKGRLCRNMIRTISQLPDKKFLYYSLGDELNEIQFDENNDPDVKFKGKTNLYLLAEFLEHKISEQPASNISCLLFTDAIYNHEQITKLKHTIINNSKFLHIFVITLGLDANRDISSQLGIQSFECDNVLLAVDYAVAAMEGLLDSSKIGVQNIKELLS